MTLRDEIRLLEAEGVEGRDEEEAVGVRGAERQEVAPLLVDRRSAPVTFTSTARTFHASSAGDEVGMIVR